MWLKEIIKWFLRLFQKPIPSEISLSVNPVLPHPEEQENTAQTVENTDIAAIITEWLVVWQVPAEYWDYWRTRVEVKLDPHLNYPAAAYEVNGNRHIVARPEWFNKGVVAHEQGHNSYSLLTDIEKSLFAEKYHSLNDTLVNYLWTVNSYGLTSDIEAHAEIYRFLGGSMPQSLKQFYPKLF